MNVLSDFDGMSCGQIALERAGIEVSNYFASEVDKWAIKITQKNYPDTIQLGDVIAWQNWHLPKLDLLLGGSPCQGFSIAGKRLNWDDPRSQLFFRFVDCLRWFKPEYFLFENVARMRKDVQDAISLELGVEPIKINSVLVSAQNRERLYWTNIPDVIQPEDKGIILDDILGSGHTDRLKSYTIDANYFKGGNPKRYFEKGSRQLVFSYGKKKGFTRKLDKAHALQASDYKSGSKSPTVPTCAGGNTDPKVAVDEFYYRNLTPVECERLQTVPDNYTEGVSNTQRYKMIGNGWTVDIIAHILSFIKEHKNGI
jgi:site-specific DNA-cytosine methylase